MIVEFKRCSEIILREMVESFYDVKVEESLPSESKWTPAEVNQILFRNFKNMSKAIEELNSLTPQSLYSFKAPVS